MRITASLAVSGYKVVVIGGGSGGCAISHRCRKLVGKGQVAVIEPTQEHHYQPGYTLVGGGLYTLPKCIKPMKKVLHPDNVWIKQAAKKIIPNDNTVELGDGTRINYDILIVAAGIVPRFDMVDGLNDAIADENVCSVYRSDLSVKTYERLKSMKEGNAVFTLSNTPIKCPGAAQKICYLADEIFRKNGVRNSIHLTYNTHLPEVFDVPKYTITLNEIVKQKSIDLRVLRNLKSVNIAKREAIFDLIDSNSKKPTGKTEVQKFDLLHVAPPFSTPEVLHNSVDVVNETGFLDINSETLQHVKYGNIFGIGDCCGSPNKKTAAAVFSQMRTLSENLSLFIQNKPVKKTYNCYASCPFIVNFHQVILSEFTPDGPLETLPVDQSRPRYISFVLKRYLFPLLYWTLAVKGHWLGPSTIRKILHLGFSK